MTNAAILVSATIVLIFSGAPARANPQDTVPEIQATPEEPSSARPIDENLNLSAPPAVVGTPSFTPPPYYPYQQQLTFRFGASTDAPKIDFDDIVFGFQYLFPKFLSPKLEAGADLQRFGRGHVHAGLRWIYFERSYFRPSFKVALDHFADSADGLATLTHIDNWYARLGATLEQVVWNPYSVRLEAEMAINFRHTELITTLGLSRGW